MATVGLTYPQSQQRVLGSVIQNIKTPGPRQRHENDVSRLTILFQRQLETDTRDALGIDNEQHEQPQLDSGTSFKAHFITCPSLGVVGKPTDQDQVRFKSQILKAQSLFRIKYWLDSLGADRLKKIFAAVIDKHISDFVAWAYSGIYNDEVQSHLKYWSEHILAVYIRTVLYACGGASLEPQNVPQPCRSDVEKYQNMALLRLWSLRVEELFDIVVDWDGTVAGIDDLRTLLTTAQSRQYVTEKFADALQTRLLHPGASTIEIFQIYISTIRAFRRLDPRGVLLNKVSGRVRQYLRERDDTIRVVVAGLLSDISVNPAQKSADQMSSDVLTELAWELQHRDTNAGKNLSNLDWNNMDWQPDPIDAAPDQLKSSKHADVIGSIISLFDSKDVFVKELQNALAERLLQNKTDYDQETSVLEHLKIRFGDSALQACEVMLRDVLDSRRLDQVIRKDQGLHVMDKGTRKAHPALELHAKILSRLFWPSLPGSVSAYGEESEPHFKPPLPILHQRNLYEAGFELLKQTRKLTWNDHIGQVEIELEFADGRTYRDEVLPYQAGVIYAFNDDSISDTLKSDAITKTVTELSEDLGLSATLVRSACLLFVSKRVLSSHPSLGDAYTVLEHLPPPAGTETGAVDVTTHQHVQTTSAEDSLAAAAVAQAQNERAAEAAVQQAMKEAETKEKRAKMAVYQQFITAMLTNQGSMPLPRIAMMLGMVVPGGFPYSNEELRDFLAAMIRDGAVEMVGANYKKAG